MPLYTQDGEGDMGDAFRDTVIGSLDQLQFPAQAADGLVVCAVGKNSVFSVYFGKETVRS